MRPFAIALLSAVAVLAAPSSAGAYSFLPGNARWEVPRIPYYLQASTLAAPVARAAADWADLGMRVRFVRTTSRRRAFVVVSKAGSGCSGGAARPVFARERGFTYIARARVVISPGCGPRLTAFIATHELGHVLGLGHETRRCALMNPSGDHDGISPQCGAQPLFLRTRDFIRADDGAGALALYRRPLVRQRLSAYRVRVPF